MSINITMPALSPTMEEGTLAKWLVKEGDSVESGDVIAEIETDKATMEVEAVDEGVIGKILVAEGTEGVAVNSVIAVLLEEGETEVADAGDVASPVLTASTPVSEVPVQRENLEAEAGSSSRTAVQPAAVTPATASTEKPSTRVFASPLAKRIAGTNGLDLTAMTGSGPHGRIVKRDVEAALKASPLQRNQAPAPAPAAATATSGTRNLASSSVDARALADAAGLPYEAVRANGMRKTIANRLVEAKQTVPHFYLTLDLNIDPLLALRKDINASLEARGLKVSVNDLVIKAAAMALMDFPSANASWNGDEILYYQRADVSVAVATDGGLITPIIQDANNKSLTEISAEIKDKAERAQSGKLLPQEYQGGTFSVSNLGMFGITQFDAVINPPQGAILAVGAGEKRPVVQADGSLGVATMMTVTLSCDHRVVDGAVGAQWLQAFKARIEKPLSMLV